MVRTRLIAIMVVAAFGLSTGAVAQDATSSKLEVTVSPEFPEPNAPIQVRVTGAWPASFTTTTFDYAKALSSVEVFAVDDQSAIEADTYRFDWRATVYVKTPGLYVLGPFEIAVHDKNGDTQKLRSHRVFLEAPKGAVKDAELRANKPLQSVSWQWPHWGWGVFAASLLLLGAMAFWWYRRAQQPAPAVPPIEEYQAAVSSLMQTTEPQALLAKEPAFALSHIVRRYMERQTGIPALEMTARELEQAIGRGDALRVASVWQQLTKQCHALEAIKYRPGAVGDRSLADWVEQINHDVQAAEAAVAQSLQAEPS